MAVFTNRFYGDDITGGGSADWLNPQYNPTQNDNGYTRFDDSQFGSGLEKVKNYAQGGRTFDTYAALKQGQPGYDKAEDARRWLAKEGISDWRNASDFAKFSALDAAFRGAQHDNQKVHSPLGGLGGIIGPLAGIGASFIPGVGPIAAGAIGGGFGGLASGSGFKGLLTGAALGGAGGYIGSKISPFLGGPGGDTFSGFNSDYFSPLADGGISAAQYAGPAGLAAGFTGPALGNYYTGAQGIAGRALNDALPGTFGAGTPLNNAGSGALGLGRITPYNSISPGSLGLDNLGRGFNGVLESSGNAYVPPGSSWLDNISGKNVNDALNLAGSLLNTGVDQPSGRTMLPAPSVGGGQLAPYNPRGAPPPMSLPNYFDFGSNPFGRV